MLYFVSSNLLPISISIGTKYGNWMLTANTLAVAAICPFVGYITDLLGRRWMCLGGTFLLIIASIVQGTAQNFAAAVSAQAIGGIGAGICELVALAGYGCCVLFRNCACYADWHLTVLLRSRPDAGEA